MNARITTAFIIIVMTSVSCVTQRPPNEQSYYISYYKAFNEPTDIKAEINHEQDTYIRLLYEPAFTAPICITVRGGDVLSLNAIMRTQIAQISRGIPYGTSYDPHYMRNLYCADSIIDQDTYTDLIMRILDLKRDISGQRPPEIACLDGETCLLEFAEGTNECFTIEVWSPQERMDAQFVEQYENVFPGKTIDTERINDFLRRMCNVMNWFAERTKIKELDHFRYEEGDFQQAPADYSEPRTGPQK